MSSRLPSRDAHPDEVTLFVPMPRIAPTCLTTALKASVSLGEDLTTVPFSLREINPDDHKRPVGGQDRATRGLPSNEEVWITPRQPHPIHNILRQVQPIRNHEMPPSGGLPHGDQEGSNRLLFPWSPPHPTNGLVRHISPTCLPGPRKAKSIHPYRSTAPMQRVKLFALGVVA